MHKLLFSINSGRAGSKYLCQLLNTAENATAFHEHYPDMAGRRVAMFPASKTSLRASLLYIPIYALKYYKVISIKKTLKTLAPRHIYAEMNHMFILSFYDVIMNHFNSVSVILLRRYLPKVLKSFIELDLFGNSPQTPYWATPPDSPSAAIQPVGPTSELDQYDQCISFLIDIEARAQRFKTKYPNTMVVEARLEQLNEWEHVMSLFDSLELIPTEDTKAILGKVVNVRTKRKEMQKRLSSLNKSVSEEYCLQRIMQYIEKCEEQGIELPPLPQLTKI